MPQRGPKRQAKTAGMNQDPDESLPEHVRVNRAQWDADAPDWVAAGERAWAAREPTWGVWNVPETTVGLLPKDMTGMDAIELGCGTGYVAAWMARRGATVTAIDNSQQQLETARRLDAEHRLDITWIHGNAEQVPQPDGSYDFAVSEYGAAIWCDPFVWVPEAHRLLRTGGVLAFLGNHPLSLACTPTRRLAHLGNFGARLVQPSPHRLAAGGDRSGRHRVHPAHGRLVPPV